MRDRARDLHRDIVPGLVRALIVVVVVPTTFVHVDAADDGTGAVGHGEFLVQGDGPQPVAAVQGLKLQGGQMLLRGIPQLLQPLADLRGKDPAPDRGGSAIMQGTDDFGIGMVGHPRGETAGADPGVVVQIGGEDRVEIGQQQPDGHAAFGHMGEKVGPGLQPKALRRVAAQPGAGVEDAEGQQHLGPGVQHQVFQRRKHLGGGDQRVQRGPGGGLRPGGLGLGLDGRKGHGGVPILSCHGTNTKRCGWVPLPACAGGFTRRASPPISVPTGGRRSAHG